jgi:hypothetical protein
MTNMPHSREYWRKLLRRAIGIRDERVWPGLMGLNEVVNAGNFFWTRRRDE